MHKRKLYGDHSCGHLLTNSKLMIRSLTAATGVYEYFIFLKNRRLPAFVLESLAVCEGFAKQNKPDDIAVLKLTPVSTLPYKYL